MAVDAWLCFREFDSVWPRPAYRQACGETERRFVQHRVEGFSNYRAFSMRLRSVEKCPAKRLCVQSLVSRGVSDGTDSQGRHGTARLPDRAAMFDTELDEMTGFNTC